MMRSAGQRGSESQSMSRSESQTVTRTPTRTLALIGIAVIASSVLLLVVVLIWVDINGPVLPALNQYHSYLLPGVMIIALTGLLTGKRIMSRGVQLAKNSINPFPDKLNVYRNAFVRYLVLVEFPIWVSLAAYLFTGSFPFLALGAVLIGVLLTAIPFRSKLLAQLGVDEREDESVDLVK